MRHWNYKINIIQNMFKDKFSEKSFTTAEFCNVLGKISKEKSKFPEKSFLTYCI